MHCRTGRTQRFEFHWFAGSFGHEGCAKKPKFVPTIREGQLASVRAFQIGVAFFGGGGEGWVVRLGKSGDTDWLVIDG